ncbi:NTE family protein RssA [Thalassovita gelatinovora]|uniref:NTE family protein RssA n=1 Tax=Thalassovita gelatinovora TaxID=53501 RepID=A0A0P1F501_THAGE|nr:patatin-like phospholipase family protein [Thalassovita gelatinovora]QIZ79495.1 patatin [Thalassovita gelatinovora]CUH62910.1 NTE family protein RssA [Thalassovita gelatinovora]SEQ12226.1 NTE family protein [Thalassovita gelatinovora]
MQKTGLALGSGGARGWCHIGVIRELHDIGVHPELIAGCSMGALVGAAYAGGRLDALETWVRNLTPARIVGLVDFRLGSGGIVAGSEIMTLMDELDLPERIEDLNIPFTAVATDMETGREIWLREGRLKDAVRASVSIPGVFSPHRVDGHWMLDGGLTNPVPVSTARAMGAEVIVAVNPNAKLHGKLWNRPSRALKHQLRDLPDWLSNALLPDTDSDRPPGYTEVVSTAIDVMTEQIRRARLAGEPPHALLNADLSRITVLEFHRGDEAITEGRRIVKAQKYWILDCAGSG